LIRLIRLIRLPHSECEAIRFKRIVDSN
jgi:hypothetical protein